MKVKPYKEQVLQLALQFLQKQLGEVQIVQKLREKHLKSLPQWVLQNNLLIKKGLIKIIKSFAQMDKKIKQYYVERKPQSEGQPEQQSQEPPKKDVKAKKPRKASIASSVDKKQKSKAKPNNISLTNQKHPQNTSTWVKNKFQAPQKLQQIGKQQKNHQVKNKKKPSMTPKQASSQESQDRPLHSDHDQSSEQIKPRKKKENGKVKQNVVQKQKNKKKQTKKQSSSEQSSQEYQKKQKQVTKSKKLAKQQKKQQKEKEKEKVNSQAASNSEEKVQKMRTRSQDNRQQLNKNQMKDQYEDNQNKGYKRQGNASTFSRIKIDEVGPIPQNLQDNSFEAKFKYGKGGDEWGRYGHEKLKDTRGQSFKKTKDKLKNKAFQGANIDFNVINSIKLD